MKYQNGGLKIAKIKGPHFLRFLDAGYAVPYPGCHEVEERAVYISLAWMCVYSV